MGKKKEPSVNDSLDLFKEIIKRAGLKDFTYIGTNMFCRTAKDINLSFHFDQPLWAIIIDDNDLKDKLKEVNITTVVGNRIATILEYCNDLKDGWVELDSQVLYDGGMIEISIDGFDYTIPINKTIFPIKFKKAEYNNFGYKVYLNNKVLSIKKTFDGTVPNASFTILRTFHFI